MLFVDVDLLMQMYVIRQEDLRWTPDFARLYDSSINSTSGSSSRLHCYGCLFVPFLIMLDIVWVGCSRLPILNSTLRCSGSVVKNVKFWIHV